MFILEHILLFHSRLGKVGDQHDSINGLLDKHQFDYRVTYVVMSSFGF